MLFKLPNLIQLFIQQTFFSILVGSEILLEINKLGCFLKELIVMKSNQYISILVSNKGIHKRYYNGV